MDDAQKIFQVCSSMCGTSPLAGSVCSASCRWCDSALKANIAKHCIPPWCLWFSLPNAYGRASQIHLHAGLSAQRTCSVCCTNVILKQSAHSTFTPSCNAVSSKMMINFHGLAAQCQVFGIYYWGSAYGDTNGTNSRAFYVSTVVGRMVRHIRAQITYSCRDVDVL